MAAPKRPRLWQYEVDEVWGDAPVSVGMVLIDKWKADRTWSIHKLTNGAWVGSWHAKLLGEATGELAEQVYRQWQ